MEQDLYQVSVEDGYSEHVLAFHRTQVAYRFIMASSQANGNGSNEMDILPFEYEILSNFGVWKVEIIIEDMTEFSSMSICGELQNGTPGRFFFILNSQGLFVSDGIKQENCISIVEEIIVEIQRKTRSSLIKTVDDRYGGFVH